MAPTMAMMTWAMAEMTELIPRPIAENTDPWVKGENSMCGEETEALTMID